MTEIPRGFIGTFVLAPESPLELHGAHTLACFTEQQSGEKPLLQREMGVIEDRAGSDGELVIAVFAVKQLLRRRQFHGGHLAAWAFDAAGPTESDKEFATFFVSVKQVNNIN